MTEDLLSHSEVFRQEDIYLSQYSRCIQNLIRPSAIITLCASVSNVFSRRKKLGHAHNWIYSYGATYFFPLSDHLWSCWCSDHVEFSASFKIDQQNPMKALIKGAGQKESQSGWESKHLSNLRRYEIKI